MIVSMRYFCALLFLSVNLILAALLFTSGFLLKKLEVQKFSRCNSDDIHQISVYEEDSQCWLPSSFNKAIVIVIDALRYDFVAPTDNILGKNSKDLPFQNKLKSLTDILQNKPANGILYKFIADAPTTTLQRLKGLTTGSLPTFVDAGSNFGGSEIMEDNIIKQMHDNGMNITFMGDETWVSLYPEQLPNTMAYSALNNKDLDVTDNKLINHLSRELKQDAWNVLIAHFLGVDHCGHTYGPFNPKMAEKLQQMDSMLKFVLESMDGDTVLFVMGDHGMTKTGDHGGDSKEEVEAALFVYSPRQIRQYDGQKQKTPLEVAQIDLVPTISLLLGLPIPYSNIGMVITDLFTYCKSCTTDIDKLKHEAKVLELNANQVRTYLHEYSKISGEFPFSKMEELENMFRTAAKLYNSIKGSAEISDLSDNEERKRVLSNVTVNYKQFLTGARKMCEQIWAKFDLVAMICGITYFVFTCIFFATMKNPQCINTLTFAAIFLNILVAPVLLILIFSNVTITSGTLYYFLCAIIFPLCAYSLFIVTSTKEEKKTQFLWFDFKNQDKGAMLFSTPFIFFLCGLFSNSFVVYEDAVTSFLVHSFVWILFYKINANLKPGVITKSLFTKSQSVNNYRKITKTLKFDIGRVITSPRIIALMLSLSVCILLRLATYFRACREEQWTCEISQFMQQLPAITDDLRMYKNVRYFFSVSVITIVPIVMRKWLRHHGNLNGTTAASIIVQYLLPLSTVCVAFHWAVQAMPSKIMDKITPWQQTLFAKCNYVIFFISVVLILTKPLAVHLLPREKNQNLPFTSSQDDKCVPKIYNHIKMNWKQYLQQPSKSKHDSKSIIDNSTEYKTPVVYGLGTVYSSTCLVLISLFVLLLAMLLGDGVAAGLIIQFLVIGIFLELYACCVKLEKKKSTNQVPWYIIVCWCLVCTHFFYGTGHQATIPAIRFDAAFVGFTDFDAYGLAIPVFLVILNMFASHVIGLLALPLLIFWPLFRGSLIFSYEKDKGPTHEQKAELVLNEDPVEFRKSLFQLFATYLLISAMKMLVTMAVASVHRRHLMVWKIFAPRFLLEGATFIFTCVMLLLVFAIVIRIDNCVSKFIKKLK